MKTSENINELATALNAASSKIGGAVKGKDNPFFKAKYADLGSVIIAYKEAIAGEGLSVVQLPIVDGGSAGVVTRLMHNSGQWIEQKYLLPMVKNDPQAAGACITYARRFALAALFGIPTADSDAEAAMYRAKPEMPENVTAELEGAENLEALQELFKSAWNEYPENRKELTSIKDARKKELLND